MKVLQFCGYDMPQKLFINQEIKNSVKNEWLPQLLAAFTNKI